MPAGGNASYTVQITDLNGFSTAVTLSVSGLPNRSSASFNPNPATSSAVLTVSTSRRTNRAIYALTITGSGGGVTHSITVKLQVT